MLDIVFLAIFIILVIFACIYDDPSCNHKHDFEGPDAMALFLDGVLVGRYCSHPGCSIMRWEENPDAEEK